MKSKFIFLIVVTLFTGHLLTAFPISNRQIYDHEFPPYPAKNIILMIGDGMGLAQVSAAALKKHGMILTKKHNSKRLNLETLPYLAYANTFSENSLITDSAASGTAIATGEKTNNEIIAMDTKGSELKTILELARDLGKSTGLITSVPVNHATPAVFAAHETSRNSYEEILLDYFYDSLPNVILGGGLRLNKTTNKDNRYYYNLARSRGYQVINMDNIRMLYDLANKKNFVFGIFDEDGNDHLTYNKHRKLNNNEPHLYDLVKKGISILERNPNGFFLMVEGGAIDWAAHNNDTNTVISEVLEFDKAVGEILNWIDNKPGRLDETLIIITADHETGGFGINGPAGSVHKKGKIIPAGWTTSGHTGIPVLVWSGGPYASMLQGKIDNTYIFTVMKKAFGIFE